MSARGGIWEAWGDLGLPERAAAKREANPEQRAWKSRKCRGRGDSLHSSPTPNHGKRKNPAEGEARRGWKEFRGGKGSAFASDLADHLTATVVAAARAGDMAGDGGAAFWAALECGCLPAVCALTHALAALGLSALRIGHESIEVGSVLLV